MVPQRASLAAISVPPPMETSAPVQRILVEITHFLPIVIAKLVFERPACKFGMLLHPASGIYLDFLNLLMVWCARAGFATANPDGDAFFAMGDLLQSAQK